VIFTVQVPERIGLKPIGQDAKQQMTRQVRGRSPPEYGVPTALKVADVEITQTRDLDINGLAVWQSRTDSRGRHDDQDDWRLDELALLAVDAPAT